MSPDREPDQDVVLLTLDRGDRGEIRVCRSRYEGRTFTRLALWFRGRDGAMHPGKQQVTIRDHELGDVLAALGKVAAKLAKSSPQGDGRRRREYGPDADGAPPMSAEEAGLF